MEAFHESCRRNHHAGYGTGLGIPTRRGTAPEALRPQARPRRYPSTSAKRRATRLRSH